jgi:hypothetical protein
MIPTKVPLLKIRLETHKLLYPKQSKKTKKRILYDVELCTIHHQQCMATATTIPTFKRPATSHCDPALLMA